MTVVAFIVPLAGCGGPEEDAAQTAESDKVAENTWEVLAVGGLPVTCNLSLPIACMAMENEDSAAAHNMTDMAEKPAGGIAKFEKFNGWPELKEAFMSGRLQAGYLLAPMVMDLADKGVPAKVVAIGHRSGAVIMVSDKSTAKTIADLKGKRVAIPSRLAVDHLFVLKMMEKYGLKPGELTLIEMAPPDMPAALHAGSIDGYATGEPFGAKAQMGGYARTLHMTRDEWPDYICCVVAVRQELIDRNPALVQKLVNYVLSAGDWLDAAQANRHTAAKIASDPKAFGQDPKLLKFVMDNPPDRVTYGDLRLVRQEFENVMNLAVAAKVLSHPIAYETYVDETFMKNFKRVPIKMYQDTAK